MVNLDLIEFKKDHAHVMVNALMNDPMVQLDDKYHEQLDGLEVPGMSFTAVKDNKIICSVGVIPVWIKYLKVGSWDHILFGKIEFRLQK